MRSTAAVSPTRCICPRLSVAVCSGIWATPTEASAAAFTQSYRRVSTRGAPAGAVVSGPGGPHRWLRQHRPRVCGRCFRGRAWATACATRSTSSRRNSRPSRPRCARRLRSQFHTLLYRARQRKSLRVFALGQRLRHFADHVATTAGAANGERVRRWFQDKKAGWYAVLADPQMPVTSTLLDQAHNAIERKLFAMKGFHHPRWEPTGVSHGAGAPVQPGPLSASGPACRAVWGGSGRRAQSRHATGCSTCKSSPQEAFDER